MNAPALLAELEQLDTEPAPGPVVCTECRMQMPDAPAFAACHSDCDEPGAGWVSVAGRFLPPPHADNSPAAIERRSALVAQLQEIFENHPIDEIGFALRTVADDAEELPALRAELEKP